MRKATAIILCLLIAFAATACESKHTNIDTGPQYYEGGISDTMNTYFFDFTVNSAAFTKTYSDITLDEDVFLVANVTVKNTTEKNITMFDTDFQAQWDDDADDAYRYPITYDYEDGLLDPMRQFPIDYELGAGESRTGELVFIVPEGSSEYSISYQELFETKDGEETLGDVFFVFFKP